MDQPPAATLQIPDFPGLITHEDPDDLKPGGATLQINLTCATMGEMNVRGGIRQVIFEDS